MAGFFRGATVIVTATFASLQGEPIDPDTVTVKFTYKVNGVTTVSAPFTMLGTSSGAYAYHWDSSGADAGRFSWIVRGVSGSDSALAGGTDRLF